MPSDNVFEKYYLFNANGKISIEQFDDIEKLNEYIESNWLRDEIQISFLDELPETWDGRFELDEDIDYDKTYLIILKGKVIMPKPVEIVRKYTYEEE